MLETLSAVCSLFLRYGLPPTAAAVILCSLVSPALGVLHPCEVLVVANGKSAASVDLARYYMQRREVPEDNLLRIQVSSRETISRLAYEEKVAEPVRKHLEGRSEESDIRCILLMYGVPLRVTGPGATREEARRLSKLRLRKGRLEARLDSGRDKNGSQLREELEETQRKLRKARIKGDKSASLDSELALVQAKQASPSMWLRNPYCLLYSQDTGLTLSRDEVLMTCRLDGPSPEVVRRMIEDSLAAERKGLAGTAYFDARWEHPGRKEAQGYARYDKSLHAAAERLRKASSLPVALDKTPRLFQPGDCPSAALYCGWYSLGHYVDAFDWMRGAVGYHIASSECATLKGDSKVWCKRMLEDGAAATLGPVEEPYVQAFPLPEVFFGLLIDGYWSLAEVYALASPFWSWKMVLVGDPLYRPFALRQGPGETRE